MYQERIDELAYELSTGISQKNSSQWNERFTTLYELVSPLFDKYYTQYIADKNLRNRKFDIDDYHSRFNMAVYDAVIGFDINKGGFLPRLWHFCYRQFESLTVHNFAKKRFSSDLLYIDKYGGELPVSTEDIYCADSILEIVEDFIATDKYGPVIAILMSTDSRSERSEQLAAYFGQYGSRERKRVQRTRERLLEKLKEVT